MGLNFVWAHANRVITQRERATLFITGPGRGGPANVANAYLEGTSSQVYTGITEDEDGMRRLFRQFSYPGGIPSHAAPETPGSIHEGGELGYALSHAYGAVFDNPELVTLAVVGDGEAETGPLAGSWTANQFVDPAHDGAVLPVLHLNGYKIANPTVLARMSDEQLTSLFTGYGYTPHFVEVTDPRDHAGAHRAFAAALNYILSSHVWQQDHNGFSHQDPGFLEHMLNKKPEVIRAHLPVDANTLLSTMDHVLRSRDPGTGR